MHAEVSVAEMNPKAPLPLGDLRAHPSAYTTAGYHSCLLACCSVRVVEICWGCRLGRFRGVIRFTLSRRLSLLDSPHYLARKFKDRLGIIMTTQTIITLTYRVLPLALSARRSTTN